MHTMVEALVRERMHEQVADAQRARLVRRLSAAQRWERREARFRQAELRHRLQVERLDDVHAPSRVTEFSWA